MIKKLEDNKYAFVLISLISIAIAMFGLIADSICNRFGGYAIGAACATILFAVLCLVYSQSSKEVKTRTKDMFFMSLFIVIVYSIISLLVDIAQIQPRTWAGLEPMGIAILVFVGLYWAIGLLEVTRLVLDIFNIRIKIYEELLEGKNPFKKKSATKEEIAVNEEIDDGAKSKKQAPKATKVEEPAAKANTEPKK